MILNEGKKNKPRMLSNSFRLIFKHIFSLLLGQSILLVVVMFLLIPFIRHILNFARSLSEFSYITINNFIPFVLNPFTIITLIFLFFFIGIFLLYEAAFLVTFYSVIENGQTPRLLPVFYLSFKRLIVTLLHRNFTLIPTVWLFALLYNIPFLVFILKNFTLFRYASKYLKEYTFLIPIIISLGIFLFLLMFRRLFVFQYSLIEGKSYKEIGTLSKKLKRKRAVRAFFYILGWNISIGILVYLLRIVVLLFSALLVIGFVEKNLAIVTFITINEKANNYLSLIMFFIGIIANFALFTHLFYQYKKEENEYFHFDSSVDTVFLRLKSYKKLIIIFCSVFFMTSIYMAFDIIKNDAPLVFVDFDMIKVTSHRGFSNDVPENTIPAIEKSMEEQADYVEIDVRQTMDGELVLLHDENLKRTTGLNKNIWNVEYNEISSLDAGSWMDESFAGTKIPTLREVFELCKGQININLDLKYDKQMDGLEERVVKLIEEYDMENQCVISSSSLKLLENVKELNTKIRTGYITYRIEPKLYESDNIDFFSINNYFISEKLLKSVHEHGKEIHVWTVNTKSELERMKNLGVDNIITDDPSYAKEILYQDESNWLIVTLFRMMLTY